MRKIFNGLLGLLVLLAFGIYQFGIVGIAQHDYEEKALYVAKYNSETPTPEDEVDTAFWLAERDIRYHLRVNDDTFLAEKLSATANLSYNLSYILNLPAKLIHNVLFDIQLVNDVDQTDLGTLTMATVILFDLVYAIVGFVGALLMLLVGTVVGLVCNPINTFLDIPACIWGLLKTVFYAIYHLFAW
ncbi:hypothetical protein POF51_31585 [Brevibacillus sp. AG]|uniref:hypothetical protein n=1 Tax=Brevibacillus sp. AG TaxID=3020891 RepID=UPI00232E9E50|nr:hypothetical protein [Brevibacillus sp. AG]MDC0765261.1 hypothetical protein [Brevibacillus sp. AG]